MIGRFCILSLLISLYLPSIAQRTTRTKLKPIQNIESPNSDSIKVIHDTIVPDDNIVVLSGYDKPRKSRKESFFVTNSGNSTLIELCVDFIYYDMDGRMIHKAEHKINCNIPSGETRQLYIPSWDKQLSFYYCKSSKSPSGIPYEVEYTINNAIFIITSNKKH